MKVRQILVATDLSDAAEAAYRHAEAFARAFGARVTLLYVDTVVPMGFHTSDALIEHINKVQSQISERLNEAQQGLAERGVDCDAEVVVGDAAESIMDFIGRRGVDLLIIARRSRTMLERLLVGSTTRKLVRHLKIPALVVDAQDAAGGGEPIVYGSLLTTTDFSQDSHLGLQRAVELSAVFEAPLTVLHVMAMPVLVPALPGEAGVPVRGDFWETLRRFYEGELSSTVLKMDERARYKVIVSAEVAPTIVSAAEEAGASLIVVPSHGKGGFKANIFGSTTERLLELSTRPVLILPRDWLRR